MTLRDQLGDNAHFVVDKVNDLLGSEDALIIGFDGRHAVSYVHGFAASACQLELLSTEIERLVRSVLGGQSPDGWTATGTRDGPDAI